MLYYYNYLNKVQLHMDNIYIIFYIILSLIFISLYIIGLITNNYYYDDEETTIDLDEEYIKFKIEKVKEEIKLLKKKNSRK